MDSDTDVVHPSELSGNLLLIWMDILLHILEEEPLIVIKAFSVDICLFDFSFI